DVLVLTKPLGTGIVAFASQIGRADPASVKASAQSMITLNKTASQLMVKFGAHACTDVTGFSLCGHLSEMALSSGVDVEVVWDNIPLFPGVLECAAAGILPGAIERNKESCGERIVAVESLPQEMVDICYDAQTSGGLLIAIAQKDAGDFLKALQDEGIAAAAIIGKVSGKGTGLVHITTDGTRKIPSPQPAKPDEQSAPAPTEPQLQSAPAQPQTDEVPCCADAVSSSGPPAKGDGSDIAQIKSKFIDFLGSASAPHGLDAYTKQAMAIALSVALRCEPCLKIHLKKAKEKGFTQDEIDEAAWMGISFGGSPTMVFYEQLKNS
ncbi:MAG: selenide, water dikinase SelD, partial [Planctomycetes bacterium]|nr:selenide, water dikinase SelD [Planctomycetota bacterium]